MTVVAIVGNGPVDLLPDLRPFKDKVDYWVGADRGAYQLAIQLLPIEFAVGDFDSIDEDGKAFIAKHAKHMEEYPSEKNDTDLEIALKKAYTLKATEIYLFGVTGGRLDHELINIQLLYSIKNKGITGRVIDKMNHVEMFFPGNHPIEMDEAYPYISFIPYTQEVRAISLSGFYYHLDNMNITWGSTRCISNRLLSNNGTFSFEKGILLLVKSCDTIQA